MKIKICGLFRGEDIDYINEALPDYAGFVFAQSRRQVSPEQARRLRQKLDPRVTPVGVFVNAPAAEITALYRSGVIEIAQLHGSEDEAYIAQLKEMCAVPVIKVLLYGENKENKPRRTQRNAEEEKNELSFSSAALRDLCGYKYIDFLMFDSGAGTGKTFNWGALDTGGIGKPWFLAGGISLENIDQAMALEPYALDISSGAETEGFKDREKILQLTQRVKRQWKAKQ